MKNRKEYSLFDILLDSNGSLYECINFCPESRYYSYDEILFCASDSGNGKVKICNNDFFKKQSFWKTKDKLLVKIVKS